MTDKYHPAAVTLHWVMAAAFLLMLGSGLAMTYLDLAGPFKFKLFQWHKSLGVILLIAFFLRFGIRLLKPVPPLPDALPEIEKKAAKAGHFALYALMLTIPLSGWSMVSTSDLGLPTVVFGLFKWPHIPGIAANKPLHEISETAHWIMAWFFGAAIVLHVAAVVKHIAHDKVPLLKRMWYR